MSELTLGLEEELFLTGPDLPTLMSFAPLARLLWTQPRRHAIRTASNFARGADARQVLMSAVEISTGVGRSVEEVIADLLERRRELAAHCNQLAAPVGNLFGLTCPTNTAGLHLHIGGIPDPEAAYRRLAWYLPLLMRYGAHAPVAGGVSAPPSWRMAHSFAIGPLDGSYTRRFQDLIIAVRLGTVEVRVLDPHPCPRHLAALIQLVKDIASLLEDPPLDLERYARLRTMALLPGESEDLLALENELSQKVQTPFRLDGDLPWKQTLAWFEAEGTVKTYERLDGWWRTGIAEPAGTLIVPYSAPKALLAFVGYYLPRLPYIIWKAYLENRT